ncbi:MAG: GH3 auxin-responsive promoter family protein [Planctomycetes bacterium]|nr:GH3 auxin-responsive promoter family protein [Planctomycetota bacterium]
MRMIFGVPTYILGLVRRMRSHRGGPGGAPIWPDVELVVTSGVGLAPHRAELRGAFPKATFREMYLASRGAIGFEAEEEGGLVAMAEDLFLEFVPAARWGESGAPRLLLGETEAGERYVPLITTPSGLYAYAAGDVVRFLRRDPPRFLIEGRHGNVLNLATEKLESAQATRALRDGGISFEAFFVCPREEGILGHEWVIEFRGDPPADAGERIDMALRTISPIYAMQREGTGLLEPPRVTAVRAGTFARAIERRPGQGKILQIYGDRRLCDEFAAHGER